MRWPNRAECAGIGELLLATLILPGDLAAQKIATPLLGRLFDSRSGDIRLVSGIPGSASLGPRIELDDKLSAAAICSDGGYAIGVTRSEGKVEFISFRGGTTATVAPFAVPNAPDALVTSPSCTSAALLYRQTSRAQLVSGLPGDPSIVELDLSVLRSQPTLAAVDDAGTALLVVTSGAGNNTVERLSAHSGPQLVISAGAVSAISFLVHSSDALVADPVANQLFRVGDAASGQPVADVMASKQDGIRDATSIAVAAGNRQALVANPGTHSVAVIDLLRQAGREVQCACDVVRVTSFKGGSLFRLSDEPSHPITLLDVNDDGGRMTVIPAEKPATEK
ncbi:MAG: hypothetical protein ACJ74Y_18650 [Bryobacteraceae bacterium]